MASTRLIARALSDRFLPALEYSDYRKLWLATLCSQSAAWALIVARGALVKDLTGSDGWVAAVTFAAMIPAVAMAPIGGYLADRFDRQTVLRSAYAVNLGQNLLLAVLVVTGLLEVWRPEILLVALSLINGCARATQMPAAQALLPNTVPPERMFNAVALNSATQQGSRFMGPLLILLMLWITGPFLDSGRDWVFFLCVGLYVLGLGFVLSIRTVSTGVVRAGAGFRVIGANIWTGVSYLYRNPVIMWLVLLVVGHCAFTMSFESLFPAISVDKLGREPGDDLLEGFSLLMVAYGAPALAMAVTLGGIKSERIRGRMFLVLGTLSGLGPVALGLSPNFALAMCSVSLMGAAQGGFMTLSHGMLQAMAPDAIRGRLLSVYTWHIQGMMAIANLTNGIIADFNITASVVLGGGGVIFLWVMVAGFGRVSLRDIFVRGHLHTPTPA